MKLDKELKEEEAKAYLNPEIAREEKDKGNALFKDGKQNNYILDQFFTNLISALNI